MDMVKCYRVLNEAEMLPNLFILAKDTKKHTKVIR